MKRFVCVFLIFFGCCLTFAQTNKTINIQDDVYSVLEYGQLKGYIKYLPGSKPYTQDVIKNALYEYLDYEEELSDTEIEIINNYIELYTPVYENRKNSVLQAKFRNNEDSFIDLTLNYGATFDYTVSGGLYTNPSYNQFSFEAITEIKFDGDISKHLSYMFDGLFDVLYVPMKYMGDYYCGTDWYSGRTMDRTVKKYSNFAYLPYRYNRKWDGQIYYLKNLDATGLEGWPLYPSLTLNVMADVRASLFNNHLIVGFGRIYRDVASMDNNSSLVLNGNARPFAGLDMQANILDTLKFSFLVGSLEYPNQDYMNKNWMPFISEIDDTAMFQNNFTMNMIEIDFKYMHLDLGSTVVWPNRFQIGYLVPLLNYVEYQNHVGDCDNLALFGNLKFRKSGLGEIWASLFIDEINGINNNAFFDTRDMFAYQLGVKYVFQKIPFATLSFRYTKVEPYCYTHQSINYAPWFGQYINENYTSGGQSLGYYLDPNSDEFRLDFTIKPNTLFTLNGCYQLIRHGAEFGSQSVPGSNLYSELDPLFRNDIHKCFLHDGAYNWMHIISFTTKLKESKTKIPFELSLTVGGILSYYTKIEQSSYSPDGKCENVTFQTPYRIVNTNEYPYLFGGVATINFKIIF